MASIRAQLIPLDGTPAIELVKDVTLVGRKEDCDVCLTHKSVSKLHCVLVKTDGLILLRDLGSTNGTRVNGASVQIRRLRAGDQVSIGRTMLLYGTMEEIEERRANHSGQPAAQGGAIQTIRANELAAAVGDVKGEGLVPLLADAPEAAEREARERGTWPVNHLVVVRDDVLDAAPALFDAFERAKDLYVGSGELEPLHARARELVGGDPLPYGVEPNRAVLEELIDFAVAQGILRKRPTVEELFAVH
jgi:hypothetical protein